MNNEIVEEKKNNTSKILIVIIIILLLALGGLSYYTFFVRDKEVDKPNSVVDSTKPIVKTTNPIVEPTNPVLESTKLTEKESLEEKIKAYALYQLKHNYEKNGSEITIDMMLDRTCEDMPKEKIKFNKYNVEENEKLSLKYEKISNGNASFHTTGDTMIYIYDASDFKIKMLELYNKDYNIFENSFYKYIPSSCGYIQLVYDKDTNTIFYYYGGGCISKAAYPYPLNDLAMAKIGKEDNIYKLDIVSSYNVFNEENHTYAIYDTEGGNLIKSNIKALEIDDREKSYEDNSKLLSDIMVENKDKLSEYEITFKFIDGYYQFDSIVKK